MSRTLTANEKSALVKLASALPAGSSERKRVLGLAKQADINVTQKDIDKAKTLSGVDPQIAKFLSETGLGDGQKEDDKIAVSKANVAAGKLKPSQTSMVLDKSLGMALAMLLGKMPLGGDLGAIISKDNHILDGHHRWSAAILAGGPGTNVGGYKADLEGKELIKVLNIVTKGMFGRMQGNPGKGSIKEYTPENIKKTLEEFVEKGSGQFSADDVKKALEKLGGSVEEGIKKMSENVKKMSKAVPGWAPDRKEMPVIEPNEVPEVAQALNKGEVNWNVPFAEKKAVLRLAALLPKGSSERRVLLAGLANSKTATDPQEMADVLGLSLKKGETYSYDNLAKILKQESGLSSAGVYLEPAIEVLVEEGSLQRVPGGYKKTSSRGEIGVAEVEEVLSELVVGPGWDPSGVRDLERNVLGLARNEGRAVLNGIKKWIDSQDFLASGMASALYAISKIERRTGVKILGHDFDEAGYVVDLLNGAYLA